MRVSAVFKFVRRHFSKLIQMFRAEVPITAERFVPANSTFNRSKCGISMTMTVLAIIQDLCIGIEGCCRTRCGHIISILSGRWPLVASQCSSQHCNSFKYASGTISFDSLRNLHTQIFPHTSSSHPDFDENSLLELS